MSLKSGQVIHGNPLLENKVRWVRICTWLVVFLHLYLYWFFYQTMSRSILGPQRAAYIVGGYLVASVAYRFFWAYGLAKPLAGKALIKADKYVPDQGMQLVTLHREVEERGGTRGRYRLYVTVERGGSMNAYAFPFIGRHIGLSIQLVEFITDDTQRAALIAHETGHLEARDMLSMLIVSATMGGLRILSLLVLAGGLWLGAMGYPWQILGIPMAVSLGVLAYRQWPLPLVMAYISRQQEFAADLYAAVLGYGPALREAMRSIYIGGRADLLTAVMRRYTPQYRIPTDNLEPFTSIYSSHPTVDKRIHLIDKVIQNDQGWIPDRFEWLLGTAVWLVSCAAIYYVKHRTHVSFPYALVSVWMVVLQGLLGMGVEPAAEKIYQKVWYWMKVIVGALVGCLAIYAIWTMPLLKPYALYLAGVWMATPLFWFSAESGLDILEPLSEFCNMVLLVAGGLALYVMLFV